MIHLSNSDLTLDLLDPETDRTLLGTRYCWGGYIWQVHDARVGPLVRGPEWANQRPDPFNGQGLPESFRFRRLDGTPLTWDGLQGVLIGGGTLITPASGPVAVAEPCAWELTYHDARLVYRTQQTALGYDYQLVRKVELAERTVVSVSQLTNRNSQPLAIEWFPHPFFALTDGLIQAEVPEGCTLPDNPGFSLAGKSLSSKKRFVGVKDGHMDFLHLPAGKTLRARMNHPHLTHVEFETSYIPSQCPVWANGLTFSIEPYLAHTLAPGATLEWSVRTTFGQPRTP